jgi:sulfatase modifying factor 1
MQAIRVASYMAMAASLVLGSCKAFKKKPEQSGATGWNYNDKTQGGYQVAKTPNVKAGPGLVFVQGGTFTMGATQEDVMNDWNNVPKRVTVNSFFIDRTEVANVHYREYMYWLGQVFDPEADEKNQAIINAALPDTLVWRSELAYNEPYVEYYFRHPSYNFYPVVGVTWKQAHDYCVWRTDRVNELALVNGGYINKTELKTLNGKGEDAFNTKSYLLGLTEPPPGQAAKSKNAKLTNPNGTPRTKVTMEDGILTADYRLPTEAEWEYAALGYVSNNPQARKTEKGRGEELITNKQVYPWNTNINGLRDNRRGAWQGSMLANFKRGSGDNMGVAGGLNDNAAITAPVESFYPNGFGLYNMAGNVSEWVADVYRPTTYEVGSDFNYFRGNEFKRLKKTNGEFTKDSTGKPVYEDEPDSLLTKRRNYNHAYALNYLDGDDTTEVKYDYGTTTLISDKSRVIKGGSWDDRPYWLSPGTRRFLQEDESSSTIGFRCAMDYLGASSGPGIKSGNYFPTKRQRR